MKSLLLVTNDFPPLLGGIETYHRELLVRLASSRRITVLAPAHPEAAAFDESVPYRVVRSRSKVLLPTPLLKREVESLAEEVGAHLVMIDPPLPTGLITLGLRRRHGTFVHGGVATQARPPAAKQLLRRAMTTSQLIVSAGEFSAGEVRAVMGERTPPIHVVNPGVDIGRFEVLDDDRKRRVRSRLGLPVDTVLVLSVSRLVPRKGMPTLVEAVASLAPERPGLFLAIGGTGRDEKRTQEAITRTAAPARMLGRIAESDLADLYGCADIFAMACHDRWAGLEQEGFGIVFAEAAACGVPSVAGRSGGSAEAVLDGETGFIVQAPTDPVEVAACLAPLMDDPDLRRRQGAAARRWAESELSWDVSAVRLEEALESVGA